MIFLEISILEIEQPRDSTEKQREIVGLKPGKRYGVKVHSTAYGLLRFCIKTNYFFVF